MTAPIFAAGDRRWSIGSRVRAFWMVPVPGYDGAPSGADERSADGLVARIWRETRSGTMSEWRVHVVFQPGTAPGAPDDFDPSAIRPLD